MTEQLPMITRGEIEDHKMRWQNYLASAGPNLTRLSRLQVHLCTIALQADEKDARIASLTEAVRVLSEALEGMTTVFRPFTLRPIGAEGSQVRIEQEEQHAAHTAARAALTTAKELTK